MQKTSGLPYSWLRAKPYSPSEGMDMLYTYVSSNTPKSIKLFKDVDVLVKNIEVGDGGDFTTLGSALRVGFSLKDLVDSIRSNELTFWNHEEDLSEDGHRVIMFEGTGSSVTITLLEKHLHPSSSVVKKGIDVADIESAASAMNAPDFIVHILDTYFSMEWSDYVEHFSTDVDDEITFLSGGQLVGITFSDEGIYIDTAKETPLIGKLVKPKLPVESTKSLDTNLLIKANKESNKMTTKIAATALIAKNKSAAITTAKITVGKAAMKQVTKLLAPKLPMMVRGYADTPVGRLLIANIFSFAVANYMANNKKAAIVADAMLEGAMMETMTSLNLEEMLEGLLDKVNISKLENLDAE